MTSRLAIMMGGRVAEELIFGNDKVTSGAATDIEQATKLARMMVTRWGLSDELGTVAYGENQEEVFLGHSVARQQNISEDTAQKIDCGDPAPGRGRLRGSQRHPHREARRPAHAGQGPARVRDADRRRDQGSAEGQAAAPRIGDRAVDAALLRGAQCRQAASAARYRRHGAAAAGLMALRRPPLRLPSQGRL